MSITTRSFYPEDPTKAGHAVTGTQVTIHATDDGRCVIGDSIVKWDEAAGKNTYEAAFVHYEHRAYTQEQAVEVFEGKIAKLLADGSSINPF